MREFPDVDPPVVSISTSYRGASAEIIERRVTQPLEDAVSGIAGVQKLTSTSQDERSSITIEFSLDRDADISPERTGVFTSGVVWIFQERRIALFFTGCKHAGENLAKVLRERPPGLPPPIQMCSSRRLRIMKKT